MTKRPGRVAVCEQLAADGIEYIFGNPGSTEESLLYTLQLFPKIRYILCLQETVAVAAADGMARATQKPVAVQLHVGVGLGNGIGMLYQAYRGHTPLLVIAGDPGLQCDAFDGQMAANLLDMARPVTKYAARVTHPENLLRVLRRAYKMAATPPMGPVLVVLPMDLLDEPCPEAARSSHVPETRVAPNEDSLETAATVLAGAQRPVILVGDGIAVSGAQQELAQVAEILAAPAWGANSSEVNLPASHPMYGGLTGHMFGQDSARITRAADAVLICGTYTFPEVFPLLDDDKIFDPQAPIVHIDLDSYEISKNHRVTCSFVADPKLTLGRLAQLLSARLTREQRSQAETRAVEFAQAKSQALERLKQQDFEHRDVSPIYMSRFADEVAQRFAPDELIYFDEALTHSPELCRYLPPDIPGHYFQTRGGSLGVALPGVLGIKLACPEKTVIAFSGDGGAMYVPQALWTAAHYKIGAKFVICNNRSYRLLKLNLLQYWREKGIPAEEFPDAFDLRNPDIRFDDMARVYGIPACRVEEPDQIGPALEEMRDTDGPFLIDLVLCDHVPGTLIGCQCGQ